MVTWVSPNRLFPVAIVSARRSRPWLMSTPVTFASVLAPVSLTMVPGVTVTLNNVM
jgi:hypothetical protein